MFCALFDVKPAAPVPAPVPVKKKALKPKKPKQPKAAAAEQTRDVAPFESVREKSPEPAPVEALDYEIVGALEEFDDIPEADEYEGDASDIEENYDATSMSLSDHEEPCGSLDSSPGIFFARRVKEPKDPKHRPPGIALTFDDDSWIA
jgi:hypothetical protein